MAREGENAANWIIGKITAYAKAISEPFSERELRLLRSTLLDFSEENRSEFLAVNGKTVRMIRETITDEKLAGAECVEARQGLYIPASWRDNYLEVYDSQMPWMISHCAQSAMLSEPTLGESTWWQSPQVTNGFRPSVVGQVETNSMNSVSADQEFDELISGVQGFVTVGKLVQGFINMFASAAGTPLMDEDVEAVSRAEAVLIVFSLSDFDDDVTSSFAHLITDKEILSTDINQRENLYSKTQPGINSVFSKEKVMTWEVAQDFSMQKPTSLLKMAFALDGLCESRGIAPVGVKLYAIKAAHLAGAVVTSSLFSSQPGENFVTAFSYGSFLKACIDISETPDLNLKSEDQILNEIQNSVKKSMNAKDLVDVMNLNDGFLASLKEWSEDLQEFCLEVARLRIGNDDDKDHEHSDPEEEEDFYFGESNDAEIKGGIKSASARLKELNELRNEGEITLEEYDAKRNQIINEI